MTNKPKPNNFYDAFNKPKPTPPLVHPVRAPGPDTNAYAAAALKLECAKLAATPKGQRDDAIFQAARSMGTLIGAGVLDEDEAVAALWVAARATGQPDHEIASALRRGADRNAATGGFETGKANPRVIPERDEPRFAPVTVLNEKAGQAVDRSTWAAVDLAPYLDGTHRPPAATIMPRSDGVCLLYPGLVHSFHGETESGKSLIMQIETARLLAAGESVLFIDFESDPGSVIQRLLEWGAPPDAIRDLLDYVHPEVDPRRGAQIDRAQFEALLTNKYALAVIDGVTDALAVFAYASKDNDDNTAWMRAFPKRIAAETGAAVALIDHVTKDSDTRGRFAIGAQAKLSGLTGAAYTVEVDQHLGRGLYGVIVLRIGKDRPGTIRARCGGYRTSDRTQEAARVIIDSRNPDAPATTAEPPKATAGADGVRPPFRPTTLMEKVSRVVEADPGIGKNKLTERVGGNKDHIQSAIDRLVEARFLTVEPGVSNRAQMHTIVTPYRQDSDPDSDRYIRDGITKTPKPVDPQVVSVPRTYTGTRGTPPECPPGAPRGHSGTLGAPEGESTGQTGQSSVSGPPIEVDRCPICRSRTRPSATGQPSLCARCTATELGQAGGPS